MSRASVRALTVAAGMVTALLTTMASAAPTTAAPVSAPAAVHPGAAAIAPAGGLMIVAPPGATVGQVVQMPTPAAQVAAPPPGAPMAVAQPTLGALQATAPALDPNGANPTPAAEGTPLTLRSSGHPIALAAESPTSSIFFKLGAVALIAGAGVWFMRRRRDVEGLRRTERSILIHTRTRVGLRSEIVWVEAGGQHLLVSLGPEGMRTLAELEAPPTEVDTVEVSRVIHPIEREHEHEHVRDHERPREREREREREPEPTESVDRRFSALLARARNDVAGSRFDAPAPAEKTKQRAHVREEEAPVPRADPGYGLEGQATGLLRARRA